MNDCTEYSKELGTMPCIYMNHDLENYYARMELPGVKKEDIHLEVTQNGLCINGKRGEKDMSGCWMLAHGIDVEKVKAKYDNGLLDIVMPLKSSMKDGKHIPIE